MGPFKKHTQPRHPRPTFVLTPLIDVMFLLLIFFMLSSQISPYSMMPVSKVAGVAAGEEGSLDATAAAELAIRVSRGFVTIGGQRIDTDEISSEAGRLVSQGVGGFLVISTGSATVQDIVTTLEALQAASAKDVTLVDAGGSGR